MSGTVQSTTLDNGLTVLTDSMAGLETVAAGIWVAAGARHEHAHPYGIAHMLEHMAFKGTKRRSARQIAEDIEAVGGYINAATGHETTAYHVRLLKDDLPLAADLLADILSNPLFSADEMRRERDVIIQEIRQGADIPDDLVFDNLFAAAYDRESLGRPITGTEETVSGITEKHLRSFMDQHYRGHDMVFSVAGAVDHDQAVRLAEKHLAQFSPDSAPTAPAACFKPGLVHRQEKALEQTHIAAGFSGVPYNDPDSYTVSVLANLLGGGMASTLFQELREKRGLCYAIFSFAWSFRDTGIIGFYAATDPAKAADLLAAARDEISRTADSASDEDIRRARTQMKAGLLMSLESASARMNRIAQQQFIFGRPVPIAEMIDKIDRITGADVRRVAGRLFEASPVIALLGPGADATAVSS